MTINYNYYVDYNRAADASFKGDSYADDGT